MNRFTLNWTADFNSQAGWTENGPNKARSGTYGTQTLQDLTAPKHFPDGRIESRKCGQVKHSTFFRVLVGTFKERRPSPNELSKNRLRISFVTKYLGFFIQTPPLLSLPSNFHIYGFTYHFLRKNGLSIRVLKENIFSITQSSCRHLFTTFKPVISLRVGEIQLLSCKMQVEVHLNHVYSRQQTRRWNRHCQPVASLHLDNAVSKLNIPTTAYAL